jgi:hypothetical protein
MRNLKKYVSLITVVGLLGVASIAFASTPAQVVTEITGKSEVEVREERQSGKTYGEIAKDNGKLQEFKTEMLSEKKSYSR